MLEEMLNKVKHINFLKYCLYFTKISLRELMHSIVVGNVFLLLFSPDMWLDNKVARFVVYLHLYISVGLWNDSLSFCIKIKFILLEVN